MVFARDAAVVVKGRDGRTVLLQSRGLDIQQANAAAAEGMTTLQAASTNADAWDILSNSQGAPLLCGRVEVMHSQLAVTYRVVGPLVFLVVTPPAANAFSCVQLLGQVVRVVMGPAEGKAAAELSAERLQRKFGEVYLAVDALLGSGGIMEAGAALARANATMEQLHDKGKLTAEAAPKQPPAKQAQAKRRTLQGAIDQLARLSFAGAGAIMQGVPPRPGFQLPDTSNTAGPPPPQARAAAAAAPGAAAAAAAGFEDDDIFGFIAKKKDEAAAKPALPAGADPNDPFAMSDAAPVAVPAADAKKPDDWQSFDGKDGKKKELGFEDNAFGAGAAAPAPPAPIVPAEPVLRLTEVWRGEAAGGRLVRAGVAGRVEWVSEGAKAKVHTVQFMVQPPEPANNFLAAALSSARRHPAATKQGRTAGVLVADGIAAKPHAGAPLLAYHLPPAAVAPPPLQARLGTSSQLLPDGRRLVTVGLHYAVSPRLAARASALRAELRLPALLESPVRAAPAGATFDAKARALAWELPADKLAAGLDNGGGAAEPFVACFVFGGEEEALVAALAQRLSCVLSLRGAAGGAGAAGGSGSLSGAGLAQGVVELELTPALCSWSAELEVKP
ncbi:hypothetical protein HXX76_001430 [Chlamydomonas incerta]|uniref:Uncharacterized protein n=1 Tax=Chlamydomonas incerta TaxID=51695 RepID=A0A835WC55_CHLIN|nr:hypothetical protein HXX76_001430 [Chlamydomonas incerta]|eukprot:KAG2444686.1 hypothetical protein HXX76_001430 [Chlamydomonas incerta]